MRPLLVRLHRWFGLGTAAFLFIAGLTGAVIAWDHELDSALNPSFYHAHTPGTPLSPLELAKRFEAAEPHAEVTFMPLSIEPGTTFMARVSPRTDPKTGAPYPLDYNQIALDPVTGAEQGRRMWGAPSLARENLIPFLYQLHYTLFMPTKMGIDFSVWTMGVVGMVWLLDGFIAIVLAFPNLKSWRKSLAFRLKRGGYALTFDLHRSGGVWLWGLLIVVAVTSISMNLGTQIVRPVVSVFSTLAPDPFRSPSPAGALTPAQADAARTRIVAEAAAIGRREGITAPPGGLFAMPEFGAYGVGYYAAGNDHGDAGLGNPWLVIDGHNDAILGSQIPGRGSAGDIFIQAQFPLHSGRIAGLPGRIAISFTGIVVAMLSVTGVLIWLKKARARRKSSKQSVPVRTRERTAS
ncbi:MULTISPECIES: PepSY-associated TM helix domain-containing protein [Paraburkholderia]|uniref:Iron-regulated membrane protein n=1 Tax=Paraburkholderia tropica TaxID=92647 RepID=A0A1A5X5D5_9BURK|nr:MULTISPECIES: PepSY-associated TM helix domain-containing protein [Paraburkholderia]MBB2984071.1 putative iron-regulated membrane protein [Paraburkholderia tropica]MBB3004906.1 putative iron-regulated membrane protein [Paraburkholderia tropica]MBB6323951.1 putative iron-regulated membrane protein [Paraburkholderia tropica]MDE1139703.1 PepSY-associated TM helix domain-containing protein [Paraburkholderia tropica]OBR48554.1 peptidase [Paraburkholderia tropica]